jgi:hypothetical protein
MMERKCEVITKLVDWFVSVQLQVPLSANSSGKVLLSAGLSATFLQEENNSVITRCPVEYLDC